jgi:hypothetical protein
MLMTGATLGIGSLIPNLANLGPAILAEAQLSNREYDFLSKPARAAPLIFGSGQLYNGTIVCSLLLPEVD